MTISLKLPSPQGVNAIGNGSTLSGPRQRKRFRTAATNKRHARCRKLTAEQWGRDWEEKLESRLPPHITLGPEFSHNVMLGFTNLALQTKGMSMDRLAELLVWQAGYRTPGRLVTISGDLVKLHKNVVLFREDTTVDYLMTGLEEFISLRAAAGKARARSGSHWEPNDTQLARERSMPCFTRASQRSNRERRSVSHISILSGTIDSSLSSLSSSRHRRSRAPEDDLSSLHNARAEDSRALVLDKGSQRQTLPGMRDQLLMKSLHSCNRTDESWIEVFTEQLTKARTDKAQVATLFNDAVAFIGACKDFEKLQLEAMEGISGQHRNLAEFNSVTDPTQIDQSLEKIVARAPRTNLCLGRQLDAMTAYRQALEEELRQADGKILEREKQIEGLRGDIAERMEAIAGLEEKQEVRSARYFEEIFFG